MVKNDRLDTLLSTYKLQTIPEVPAGLSFQVWKNIRARERQAFALRDLSNDFLSWFQSQRALILGLALALAIIISFIFNVLPTGNRKTNALATQQAMGLEVFSHHNFSPLLRLTQNP